MSIWILILLAAAVILIRSGAWVVHALVNISSRLKISEYLVSFVLMSFATTLPEFWVGISSALSGVSALSVGNIFGANIANLGLILGTASLLSGRVVLHRRTARFDAWSNVILGGLPVILLFDGVLSRLDGVILLSLFIVHLLRLLVGSRPWSVHRPLPLSAHHHHFSRFLSKPIHLLLHDFGVFICAATLLIFSSYLIVFSAVRLTAAFGVSPLIIGLIIVSLGTTLPELIFAIRASLARHSELSLGNLIGATIFNSTLILGVVAVINPVRVSGADLGNLRLSSAALIIILLAANIFLRTRERLSRREGAVLILLYLLFIAALLYNSGWSV